MTTLPTPEGYPGSGDATDVYPGAGPSWASGADGDWPVAPTSPYPPGPAVGDNAWSGATDRISTDPQAASYSNPYAPPGTTPYPAYPGGSLVPYQVTPYLGAAPYPGPVSPGHLGTQMVTMTGPAYPPVAPVLYTPVDPALTSRNWMGITSLVLGIISIVSLGYLAFLALPGVILGHLGRAAVRRRLANNDGMSLAGVIINWIVLGFGIVAIVLFGAFLAWVGSLDVSE